ncbi:MULTISPECIES: pilus assembly protein TadG-related protein [unclassified Micromonospora]|uniref:pilus assembly protein TadG-related protein n=1 Tax=unclassified Micromonospora TaxID=2617518 RepID=UPI003A8C16AB
MSRQRPGGSRQRPGVNGDASGHRDAGRVSVFLAVAFLAVATVLGITVDAAGKYRTKQRADNLAAEAARTGGQQIDIGLAVSGAGQFIDVPAATAAVDHYFDGMPGVTGYTVEVAPDQQQMTVTVDMTYETTMLSLFGFPPGIAVTGQATAVLRTDP